MPGNYDSSNDKSDNDDADGSDNDEVDEEELAEKLLDHDLPQRDDCCVNNPIEVNEIPDNNEESVL